MSTDTRRIKSEDELNNFFFYHLAGNPTPVIKKRGIAGVVVDTKLRRDVLTGQREGNITINGTVLQYQFKSLGGGVWKCTLPIT